MQFGFSSKKAEENVSAQCFRLDEHHQIYQGIGDGELDNLCRKKWLDRLLVVDD